MTEKAYPFSEGPGAYVTEDEWAAMTGGFQDSGVYGHPGSNDLTIQPGPEANTIQVNVGDAHVDGFHYRLTSPKVINTVPNSGSTDRWDTVALVLDAQANTVTAELLQSTRASELGEGFVPLGEWRQPPSTEVTSSFWGEAFDARWFAGNRVRPIVDGKFPPPVPGAFCYDPKEGPKGTVYIGALDEQGIPYWTPWLPLSSERMEVKEHVEQTTQYWSSTTYSAGSPQVTHTFQAPPSGQVIVNVFAALEGVSRTGAYLSFEVRRNNASGEVIVSPARARAALHQGVDFGSATRRVLVSGLTPGDTYFVRLMHASQYAGRQITIHWRSLMVEPVYTDVAPGTPSEGGGLDPADFVRTDGGSVIRIPNGDTVTPGLRVYAPAGDRSSAPETLGFYHNSGTDQAPVWTRGTYFDPYGNLVVRSHANYSTGITVEALPQQEVPVLSVKDEVGAEVAGIRPDGRLFAPNFVPMLVLGPSDPIPSETEPGTLILRTETPIEEPFIGE